MSISNITVVAKHVWQALLPRLRQRHWRKVSSAPASLNSWKYHGGDSRNTSLEKQRKASRSNAGIPVEAMESKGNTSHNKRRVRAETHHLQNSQEVDSWKKNDQEPLPVRAVLGKKISYPNQRQKWSTQVVVMIMILILFPTSNFEVCLNLLVMRHSGPTAWWYLILKAIEFEGRKNCGRRACALHKVRQKFLVVCTKW